MTLHYRSTGAQVQFGAKADISSAVGATTTVNVSGSHIARHGTTGGSGGKAFSGSKFPEPVARYQAFVELTLTLKDGDRTRTLPVVVPADVLIPLDHTTAETILDTHTRRYETHPDGPFTHLDLPKHPDVNVSDVIGKLTEHELQPNTVWLPHTQDPVTNHEFEQAVRQFPGDDHFFTLAYHSSRSDGAPTWRGHPIGARDLADVLIGLHDNGKWRRAARSGWWPATRAAASTPTPSS